MKTVWLGYTMEQLAVFGLLALAIWVPCFAVGLWLMHELAQIIAK